MQCLNYFAPAIQALAALVIVLLTGVLVYLTRRYVEVSEALQKPSVMIRSEPLAYQNAVLQAPHVAQVAQLPEVRLINVGTGPALNLLYSFRHVNAQPGAPVMQPNGFVPYLTAGQEWPTQLARNSLPNRTFQFSAKYESLSGKKYETKFLIEDEIIKP